MTHVNDGRFVVASTYRTATTDSVIKTSPICKTGRLGSTFRSWVMVKGQNQGSVGFET